MLVLNRRTDEVIQIGHDIKITVLEVKGNAVKIGINAPLDVDVHRSEVYERIHESAARPSQKTS